MTPLSSDKIHASCVAIGGRGVLIEGPSGVGKSDLAVRLIDRGALLVSDDYTAVERRAGTLFAAPPPTIAGRIEVRGVGIVALEHTTGVPVALLVTLGATPERLPVPPPTRNLLGVDLSVVVMDGREASAPIKVEFALAQVNPPA